MNDTPIAQAKKGAAVLVCRKCLKRVPKGKRLPRALKQEMRAVVPEGAKKPRIVMTSCFGICPKRTVVVTNGAHLARGEYLLVDMTNLKVAARALSGGGLSVAAQGEMGTAE